DSIPSCAGNYAGTAVARDRHKPVGLHSARFAASRKMYSSTSLKYFWFDSVHSVSRNPPGGPSGLEVEAARDAVNVEQLARKIEIWRDSASHGFEIDLAQSHATASDKFFFVQRLAIDFEFRHAQLPNQFIPSSARQRGPSRFRKNAGVGNQLFPKSRRNCPDGSIVYSPGRFRLSPRLKLGPEFDFVQLGKPIHTKRETIRLLVQDAGAPRGESQHGGSANSVVRDEQRPALAQFSHRQLYVAQ